MYLSPTELSEKSGLTYKETLRVLMELERQNIVRSVLVVQCECSNVIGEYRNIDEVPSEYECLKCGEKKQVDFGKIFLLFKKV